MNKVTTAKETNKVVNVKGEDAMISCVYGYYFFYLIFINFLEFILLFGSSSDAYKGGRLRLNLELSTFLLLRLVILYPRL